LYVRYVYEHSYAFSGLKIAIDDAGDGSTLSSQYICELTIENETVGEQNSHIPNIAMARFWGSGRYVRGYKLRWTREATNDHEFAARKYQLAIHLLLQQVWTGSPLEVNCSRRYVQ
jgi:hypothetical protein